MSYRLIMVCQGMEIVEWSPNGATVHLIDAGLNRQSRDRGEPSPLPKCAPYLSVPQAFWISGDPPDATVEGNRLYRLQDTAITLERKGFPFQIEGPPPRPGREPDAGQKGFFCWVPSLKEIEPDVGNTSPVDPDKIVATVQMTEGTLGSHEPTDQIWSFGPEAPLEQVLAKGVELKMRLEDGDTLKVTLHEGDSTRTVEIGRKDASPDVKFTVTNDPIEKVGRTNGAVLHFKWNQEALSIPVPVLRRFAVPRRALPGKDTVVGTGGNTGEICPPTRYP